MATLNLGRIKPVFQGAYNNSTAYVVDDIVTFGDETFICIQASTGNATSNASYWTKLAAKGTDGTDVGATLTTQGDILYRDGSGLQRLAKGTAAQVLKMNTAANAPEWGNLSSDFVKITSQESDNLGASNFSLQNCFDDSTYKGYRLFVSYNMGSTGGTRLIARFLDSSNNELGTSGGHYRRAGGQAYQRTNGNENTMTGWNDAAGRNDFDIFNWNIAASNAIMNFATCDFDRNLNRAATVYPVALMENGGIDNASPQYYFRSHGAFVYVGGTNVTGIKFFSANSNNIGRLSLQLYGRK